VGKERKGEGKGGKFGLGRPDTFSALCGAGPIFSALLSPEPINGANAHAVISMDDCHSTVEQHQW